MSAAPPSAFVGREAELARLVAALEDAAAGRAPAVVVEGESGAGKTRLLREFAALAAERRATVLFGRCVDCGEAGPPYWPFVEALRPLSPPGNRAQEHGGGRAGYFAEVLGRLEGAGRHSPTVLLLDDLHWADRSTRDLLGFLLAHLAGGPGPLVVVTVRSEALVPGHPLVSLLAELRRSRRAEFLPLDPLGKSDVAAQVTSIIGKSPEPELLDEIWSRSEGNPLSVGGACCQRVCVPCSLAVSEGRVGLCRSGGDRRHLWPGAKVSSWATPCGRRAVEESAACAGRPALSRCSGRRWSRRRHADGVPPRVGVCGRSLFWGRPSAGAVGDVGCREPAAQVMTGSG
ncbi:MAG: ATP-binding protein [Acidimicrobiia bacterium]